MHDSKTLSWYSQLPRDATESSQLALSDIFYSHAQQSPTPSHPLRSMSPNVAFDAFVPTATSTLRLPQASSATSSRESLTGDRSFEIQRVTNLRDIDPEWEDDEIDEVLVLSRKRHTKKLSVIRESIDSSKPRKGIDIASFKLASVMQADSTSKVFLATKAENSACYALKAIPHDRLIERVVRERISAEHQTLKRVTQANLPFLPRLYWSFHDEEHLYLVTGYYPSSVDTMLNREEASFMSNVKFYAAELLVAVSSLHMLGIVHRDIKPTNVLLSGDGHLILTGLHHSVSSGVTTDHVPLHLNIEDSSYAAPELLLGWNHDEKVDVWGFGTWLYLVLMKQHPFLDTTRLDQDDKAFDVTLSYLRAPLRLDALRGADEHAADLIAKCLQRNTAFRPSLETLKAHEYFRTVNWSDVRLKKTPAPIKPDAATVPANVPNEKPEVPSVAVLTRPRNMEEQIAAASLLDEFIFEWQDADKETRPSPQSLSSSEAVENSDLTANPAVRPSGSFPRAPSSSLSVTSFGELKRYRRVKVPKLEDVKIPSIPDATEMTPSPVQRRQSGPPLSFKESTPPRRGRLRKFASLDFDLDMIVPLSEEEADSDSDAHSLDKTPTASRTAPLAHLPRWSPLRSFKFSRPGTAPSPSTPATNGNFLALGNTPISTPRKLIKRTKTPVVPSTQQPIRGLPHGVEQIGNGIGFTCARSPSQPLPTFESSNKPNTPKESVSLRRSASLRPAISRYGKLTLLPRMLRNKRSGSSSIDHNVPLIEEPHRPDELEASMKETYESSWDLNSTGAAVRSAAGLGFGLGADASSRELLICNPNPVLPSFHTAFEDQPSAFNATGDPDRSLDNWSFPTLRLVTPQAQQNRNLWQN
ncbi:hypothetical protein EIP91_010121 [Steccherinum ochraceum]|uniref:Protein kinase domain-containing protein n=1 Tax=Steccherinum ochraceum TaxID=92696 RepID=A0A4R0RWX2_9APHY|nr:hypothetical protein EIP91_010121 [Steccherinum ochraceum]